MARKEKPVDVVIVGVGWMGGIMAKELSKAGMTVVGLERGGGIEDLPGPGDIAAHDELGARRGKTSLAGTTVTFRNKTSETALPMRTPGVLIWFHGVGGAGNYWGTYSYRHSPWDFKVRSKTIERYGKSAIPEDSTIQDWAVNYDELEPFYDHFERDIGVCGKAGNIRGEIQKGGNPFEGPRAREFPNPAPEVTYAQSLFKKATESLGYHPFPAPGGTMTRPYTNPEGEAMNECMYCGHCSGFTCEMNAKATPVSTVLPTALKSGRFTIRSHSTVIRVNVDSTGRKATGVTYIDANGGEVEQSADIVILSGFTFANVRLLLISKLGEPYDPKTGKGQVGRNFTYHHTSPSAQLLFESGHIFNGFMGAGGLAMRISDFQGDNFDHSGLGFIGGCMFGTREPGSDALGGGPVPRGTPAFGSAWKKASAHYYTRNFNFASQHDTLSYFDNYLDLDPTYKDEFGLPLLRVTYDDRENEKKAVRYVAGKMEQIIKAIAPTHYSISQIQDHFNVGGGPLTIHQNGGAIAGTSPGNSVVNTYLQVWQTPNVFVVGGSAFPHSTAVNPTMTAGALAYRSADAIIKRYVKAPGQLL